mgnify:CR=1 FL=1
MTTVQDRSTMPQERESNPATSSADRDRVLLLPFVGPFAAFAARDGCGTPEDCGADPTYRAASRDPPAARRNVRT